MNSIILPDKIKTIINELYENGFEAYAVGGCIRDSLMGRPPHDWDVTTSAKPEEVKKILTPAAAEEVAPAPAGDKKVFDPAIAAKIKALATPRAMFPLALRAINS